MDRNVMSLNKVIIYVKYSISSFEDLSAKHTLCAPLNRIRAVKNARVLWELDESTPQSEVEREK